MGTVCEKGGVQLKERERGGGGEGEGGREGGEKEGGRLGRKKYEQVRKSHNVSKQIIPHAYTL